GLALGVRVLVDPMMGCGFCRECRRGEPALCTHFGLLGETRHGGCAEFLVVPVEQVLPIPDGVSNAQAAALPIAYLTAWQMLVRRVALEPSETVLVQAGGSGVSMAAIQIARQLGAFVITTVGSDQ